MNIPSSKLASEVKQPKLQLLHSIDAVRPSALPLRTIRQHIIGIAEAGYGDGGKRYGASNPNSILPRPVSLPNMETLIPIPAIASPAISCRISR